MADEFTHLTDSGVHMVEVGGKPDQKRRAIASGSIFLDKHTISLIQNEEIKKGNVLTTAQIAGIQAVKNTSSINIRMKISKMFILSILTLELCKDL